MRHYILVMLLCGSGSLFAQPVITAPTQTDQIILDNGNTNSADRIRYKATIQNTGTSPATGVQLNAAPDANTTLVSGSFKSSPVAVNDGSYSCIGNVGITVAATSGVKANDYDDALASATLSVTTAPTKGSVTLNNDGSFSYTPSPGFEGSDQFTYKLTDANGVGDGIPTTDEAVVSTTVSGTVWFINASAGAGDSNSRFEILLGFNHPELLIF